MSSDILTSAKNTKITEITAEALSDPEQCKVLQAGALNNILFFQAERRACASQMAEVYGQLSKAKAELELVKNARELKAAQVQTDLLASGQKLTVAAMEAQATIACKQEDADVVEKKRIVGELEGKLAKITEDISASKQIIDGNQTIVIATLSALKQYRDIATFNA